MTASETYNRYTNYETWAFCLHLNNDQGLQEWALETTRDIIADTLSRTGSINVRHIGEQLLEQTLELIDDEITAGGGEWAQLMQRDIGSTWRIDVTEVGEAFTTDALYSDESARTDYAITDGYVTRAEIPA